MASKSNKSAAGAERDYAGRGFPHLMGKEKALDPHSCSSFLLECAASIRCIQSVGHSIMPSVAGWTVEYEKFASLHTRFVFLDWPWRQIKTRW